MNVSSGLVVVDVERENVPSSARVSEGEGTATQGQQKKIQAAGTRKTKEEIQANESVTDQ